MKEKTLEVRSRNFCVAVIMAIICVGLVFAVPVEDSYAIAKKPSKVKGVKVKAKTYGSVTITWKKASNAKSYVVYRSNTKNGSYHKVKTVKGLKFTNKKLQTGKRYWYKVRAYNGSRAGFFSKKVSAKPTLKKPSVKSVSLNKGARITAGKVKGATGYVFYRNGHIAKVQSNPVFLDKDIAVNKKHSYRVAAYRMIGGKRVLSAKSKTVTAVKEDWQVSLSNSSNVPTLKAGQGSSVSGKIKSNLKIARVEIGVVNASNKQWVPGAKYNNSRVNATTFDVSKASSSISFKSLSSGAYRYRIYAHSKNGTVAILKNQSFTVNGPSGGNRAQGAVNWAIKIANDNSFAYGTGSRAHHKGCYFCGTNVTGAKKAAKGSKWEKTYVCLTFVGAAYAHGAGDPDILRACQTNEEMTCYANNDNFKKFSCWKKIGTCRQLEISDLRPGDVLVRWGDGNNGGDCHVCMYTGKSGSKYMLAEAAYEGWGAGTIRHTSGADKRLKEYGTRSGGGKNYAKNYVMRYIR